MKRFFAISWTLLPYLLIAAIALVRLAVAHPWNFIPVFACIFFFAAMRPARELPIPLLTLIGVDCFLTTHTYGYAVTLDHAVTWLFYAAMALAGTILFRSSLSALRAGGVTLAASVAFFVASNFAVWALWPMYPKTWAGLAECYVAALPFFRNAALSETLASLLLFSACRVALHSAHAEPLLNRPANG
ncbi:MAG: DUF6580 family putative transport protein [Terracidiphilus sp.]